MSKRAATKKTTKAKGASQAEIKELKKILSSGGGEEDVAAYDSEALMAAARSAFSALSKHRKGHDVIVVDTEKTLMRDGKPVSAITVVADDMPFLFDSVLGEVNETAGEPLLVAHPVLCVKHDKKGVTTFLGAKGTVANADEADKVSMTHIHVSRLNEAEAKGLRLRLATVLKQVRFAVAGWKDMLIRLDAAISVYRHQSAGLDKSATEEAAAFLEWLRDDNFTFLGMREYTWSGEGASGALKRKTERGLGILADPDLRVLRRGGEAVTTTPQIREFMESSDALIVTKANIKSVVHRRAYLDYVGVKTFDRKGKLTGELRIVGLFTSTAYTRSVLRIPFLRSKAQGVISDLGFDTSGHSGKALTNVLETYPRDELFQIDADTLKHHAAAILALGDRPRVRVLPRPEKFGRYVSVIVFVPRDRYNSQAREDVGSYLAKAYDGRVSAFYPDFPEGSLARVHYIIGRDGTDTPKVPRAELEAHIREIVRTWDDGLREAALAAETDAAITAIATRFPEAYRETLGPEQALVDAATIADISADNPIAVSFYRGRGHDETSATLKIFHHGAPVSLSGRVPTLENMGFHVIAERTFEVPDSDGGTVFVHDMEISSAFDRPIDLADGGKLFADIFLSVRSGDSDNDMFNALAHTGGLTTPEIMILRSYSRYLQQAGIPQTQGFIAGVLTRNPTIARDLHSLFAARFDPSAGAPNAKREGEIDGALAGALADVPSLDDDTIIRRLIALIKATLRCNVFAPVTVDRPRSLAFKFNSREIDFLPEPRPWREIFVYGPEVEGVHLRFGPVARGGLRWSDRLQDYRTEVLGLVKAQQVKNAVIVPVGAKGGFFPKRLPKGGSRDEVFEAGTRAYINFVSSLLSLTDNLQGAKVVPPKGVIRHDEDDPYLVVAADKGTASFSDTANAISQDYGFWLDDAFASGGSAGYDHKKMGITARGGWEAVKRHFREMDRDIQSEPFSAVGVGDMSGDVFGNGMLLSRFTRLIAAFDHRDIFIDPDPDVEKSYAERERLFKMGRSSWQDYDTSKISAGGGVFPRSKKSITLSKKAAEAIGLDKTTASPFEIMTAILKARADLLWFGGIGTYIRATTESNAEAGDRANDAIRITAPEVRAKVIGEGANLGVTQRARIEYGLGGGRCNTDAIDNSAGVNSSDMEVNIKIAFAQAMRIKKLSRKARNTILEDMTEDVAKEVLTTNYDQTLAISLTSRLGMADLTYQARMMTQLENRGLLDRKVELLPDDKQLAERQARGEPLTRAEISVLISYAKIVLLDDILETGLVDDPHFGRDLHAYFPEEMTNKWKSEIEGHRLRREIIATGLANDVINRGGPAFVTRLQDMTGRAPAGVARAYAIVRDGFDLPAVYEQIDALDTKIDGADQLILYDQVGTLIRNVAAWYLKNGDAEAAVGDEVKALADARKTLEPKLPSLLPGFMKERLAAHASSLKAFGTPPALAKSLTMLTADELVPDIALVARRSGTDLATAAEVFFEVTETFRLGRIEEAARGISTADYYDAMALSRATATIDSARRGISVAALGERGNGTAPFGAWVEVNEAHIDRTRDRIQAMLDSGDITVSRLAVAAGLMGDLVVD